MITANIPLLRPFLKLVQSGFIDSSIPKIAGTYELSAWTRSNKKDKQSNPSASRSTVARSTSDQPLTSNLMAPYIEIFDRPTEGEDRRNFPGMPSKRSKMEHGY